ncbi:MAG TPA: carboxypeptidase-like regulatory domain-containing protein [Jatrophihabitantaceae bacterium]|nr:carboxypeptidase-like regulatory domain-containing protein [Jatrophihabitantaceae bacterium]
MARVGNAVLATAVVVAAVGSGLCLGPPSAGANVPVRSYTGTRRLTDLPSGRVRVTSAARHIQTNVNANLADAAVITGKVSVQDATKVPQSMWVDVYDAKHRHIAYVDTDAAGGYRFAGLPPVRYTLCAGAIDDSQPTGYLDQCRALTPAPGTATVEDLVIAHAGAIAGQITGSASKVAYHVDVYLYRHGKPVGPRSRNWSGHYSFTGLEPGDDYQVCFDARRAHGSQRVGYLSECTGGVRWHYGAGVPAGATHVAVRVDQTTKSDITLSPSGAIDGTVSGSRGAPLAGSHVVVFQGRAVIRHKRADSHGHYRVLGLSGGQYRVCASSRARQRRCTERTVHVAIGRTRTVDLRLRVDPNWQPTARGRITGRVLWHGQPVRDSRVEIFDARGSAFGAGRTTRNGRYSVKLPPSSSGYRVCFLGGRVTGRPRSSGYASACYGQHVWGGAAPPHHATRVSVRSRSTTRGIDVQRVRGAAISGTVRAANGGAPIEYAQAIAVNAAGEVVGVTATAADGSYTIRDLTPQMSGYTVCFAQPPSPTKGFGYLGECYRNKRWYGQMVDVVGPKHRLPPAGSDRSASG